MTGGLAAGGVAVGGHAAADVGPVRRGPAAGRGHDQAHLHRHFRRTFAAPPGQFARARRACNDVQERLADEP
ncbi:hypothetical protein Acsp04_21050 [Actinomadura sp. NBRC 104425]|uniref:hypothetical protein n=1 Tax=Actinomadura sp. NBRC 104425 TaxID=3032204 RepID=UPI0024A3273C|nr:hypothetical protein [Actinomadura sp. NBRC 104425]GLZ11870.1 hypothetical protein Acsp04_21050 [Actinomadura sp. NBRC 104425]